MSEPTRDQIADALTSNPPITLSARPSLTKPAAAPAADEVWPLHNGTAWVYYGEGHTRLMNPFITADGFNSGPSDLAELWEYLESGAYPFISQLRRRGYDVIILGFHERSASILDNSRAAQEAIHHAIAERAGDAPLKVGGFSMGGLVTRHALAKLEMQRMDHQTDLYFSYDSPHRGAWIPIVLQAFAHYIRDLDSRFSDQINSAAAQQLLWRHIPEWNSTPAESQKRTDFLSEMQRLGGWPMLPRKIAVANGVGTGTGNGINPSDLALEGKGLSVAGTKLYTQAAGDDELVAKLRVVTLKTNEVRTSGLPTIDGAPGGTLEGFGILADGLNALNPWLGFKTDVPIRSHCFVPAVSAVAIRDVATDEDLYTPINGLSREGSELDDFKLASQNEGHTLVTEELCSWIIERL
ncbi:esterase/lipase family protein [Streptomyces sp. NPDC048496]|uniref:esterase/lipase family protein n=1 Tax=Streptomyces sp. NPDC048496 TaxID=3365558 RepID=UPI0037195D06